MLKITACLDYGDARGANPVISTPPSLAGRVPTEHLTGFFGSRDHNALVREAMLACQKRGWPFNRVSVEVETVGYGVSRQEWKDFQQGSNVLNLFMTKKDLEHELAILLSATQVKTCGMLDRQTLVKMADEPSQAAERLFGDERLAGVDVIIWGVRDAAGKGYRRVATLRSTAAACIANVTVYDYGGGGSLPAPPFDPALR